ncbi:conserved hypothetical protein [Helicobacter cinaedi CCUG 18818 = ATCC BAA-847]|uniref:Tetratricopeptide repeat protein n=1 Tax=Helicobacter cinaedi CCUG 18818 = ATCC BAA-847 TaxID=537971 RepID=A0AAI8QGB4_9HELI|nr:hypothetical protein [Helicobacter cinaedi]BAM32486.1 conserved hypothetical protein [Helicobacter cinaedi CCUG 18818 = ATCC BAA-847]
MSIKSITLARIYEMHGLKEDALKIYREILLKEPNNKDAQQAIKYLMLTQNNFPQVNEMRKEQFLNPQSQDETIQFQRWLFQWNSKI